MLRSAFVVFLLGWVSWFWIDKPPAVQLPPVGDSLIENFQVAFDLLKSGYLDVAYVYIWKAHYLLLSLLGGALVAVGYGVSSDYLSRRRMRRNIMPSMRSRPRADEKSSQPDGPDSTE